MPRGVYIRTKETRDIISEGQRGRKHSEDTKKKIGEAQKGKSLTEEHKRKVGEFHKGKKLSKEHREKLRQAMLGKKASEDTKEKMSESHKNISEETREKMRKGRFAYIKKCFGVAYPVIGRNETQILDELEKEINYRIIRQYKVGGYYIDGYIPEINLAIEVDEKYHEKKKEKDIQREEFIKAKLGCEFMRIKDYN